MDAIVDNTALVNDGAAGLRVVTMLEAAAKSVSRKGELVEL
jgi:hypothetical protein